jgi:nitrite reductase (NADH) small subunit/3-phenylpropionate/trans-cinnamate dioxygenase ferredoxin subunit
MTASVRGIQALCEGAAMAEFQTVCKVGDLGEGEARTVTVGGKLVALFRVNGAFHAIDDVCPHMGASLAGGDVEGGVVTCSWHGWRFRLADGAWADNPRLKIGCYSVRVAGDEVQVEVPAAGVGGKKP